MDGIYLCNESDQDLVQDQNAEDNAELMLVASVPFRQLANAKQWFQSAVDDDAEDERNNLADAETDEEDPTNTTLEWEHHAPTPGNPDAHEYWLAQHPLSPMRYFQITYRAVED